MPGDPSDPASSAVTAAPIPFPLPKLDLDEQLRTPLFDAMVALAESKKVSFHTPGHKSGKGISTRFRKFVGPKIFSIDLTTLDEVDSLHKPKGVIKEAQALAAKAYGADRSFFLVNGTTGGNHAMILSTCRPGDRVLVARNAHKSIIAGLILSGARPAFFDPVFDPNLNLMLNVTLERVKKAIDANPNAKRIVLTSPNYYGICADLVPIIAYAHQKGLIVLVDEAHGPHLTFHPELPISGVQAGADLCVQSVHKIVGGMTQASILHARAGRIDMSMLARVLRMVQTTSPSYILMASLDLARMQMATEGHKLLDKAITLAEEARARINKIAGVTCFSREDITASLFARMGDLDVTKLTIGVSGLGLTGYQVSQILNTRFSIQVEMADPFHVLVIVSIGDRKDDLNRLVDALKEIAAEQGRKGQSGRFQPISIPTLSDEWRISPQEAFLGEHEQVDLHSGIDRVSAETVTVYPPGIPVLTPGEVITKEAVRYLEEMLALGATVDGLDEGNRLIGVVKRSQSTFTL
jgi:lysine decarboxylase